jgi:hypothetical protein
MSNPFELRITLRQHTPIIHFQHHQDGATLRASEVKPKLDRFLIDTVFNNNFDLFKTYLIGYDAQEEAKFIREDKVYRTKWAGKEAFDYKISLNLIDKTQHWTSYVEEPKMMNGEFKQRDGKTETYTYPAFFGNMGKDFNEDETIKKFEYYENIELRIQSKYFSLVNSLKSNDSQTLKVFFLLNNFGTRQGKGFGCFLPLRTDILSLKNHFDYHFTVSDVPKNHKERFKFIFNAIDLFYRTLRGGINTVDFKTDTTVFYFKSLLFKYWQSQTPPIQWEKKTIKQSLFEGQQQQGTLLVKDMLGLASEELWLKVKLPNRQDRDTIEKIEAKKVNNNWVAKDTLIGDSIDVERYPSPIFFKVVETTTNNFTVFIKLNEAEKKMLGHTFMVQRKKRGNSIPLSTPTVFDIKKYFKEVVENLNIDTHIETGYHNRSEFKTLKAIYQSLTPLK